MFLSNEDAFIALYTHTNLSCNEIEVGMVRLKSNQSSIFLNPTGCKLKYDTHQELFYLDSYCKSELDVAFIYDSLDMINTYWDYLADELEFSESSIQLRKKCYLGYKESFSCQVA